MAVSRDISICNAALVLIGGTDNAINTFADDTRESRICAQLYEITRDSLISRHPWKFSLGQARLARLIDDPLFGYEHAFQLPTDPLLIQAIKAVDEGGSTLRLAAAGRETQSYRILEDKLYSNSLEVDILYQFQPDETTFPPYFVEALEFLMAEKLALALEQDETLADRMNQRAERRIKKARSIDSRNDPPFAIPQGELALTSVR